MGDRLTSLEIVTRENRKRVLQSCNRYHEGLIERNDQEISEINKELGLPKKRLTRMDAIDWPHVWDD